MNEYKRRLLYGKKRGEHCIIDKTKLSSMTPEALREYYAGGEYSCSLCGCGTRTPPSVKHRRRIVRRSLQNDLREMQQ